MAARATTAAQTATPRKLAEKQKLLEEQQQEIEQLKEALYNLKNRDSSNSSIPPSSKGLATVAGYVAW